MPGSRILIGGVRDAGRHAALAALASEVTGDATPLTLEESLLADPAAAAAAILAGPSPGLALLAAGEDSVRSAELARQVRLLEALGIRVTIVPAGADSGELREELRQRVAASSSPDPPETADRYRVTLAWRSQAPLLPGRAYTLSTASQAAEATVNPLRYRLDLESGQQIAATTLEHGEIGVCDLELPEALEWPQPNADRHPRAFLLRDRQDDELVATGLVSYALRRSANVRWQELSLDREARADALGQRPAVVWLTGLPGAGKSTIANLVEQELHRRGHHAYVLDGDNVRHGLNSDLGFTDADRVENIRRVAEVARLMADAGLIVIVAFISPFRAEREFARGLLDGDEFLEVWVDAPLEEAERRDPKGLYAKARRGELVNLTGLDSRYEPPAHPDLRIDTVRTTPAEAAAEVLDALARTGRLRES